MLVGWTFYRSSWRQRRGKVLFVACSAKVLDIMVHVLYIVLWCSCHLTDVVDSVAVDECAMHLKGATADATWESIDWSREATQVPSSLLVKGQHYCARWDNDDCDSTYSINKFASVQNVSVDGTVANCKISIMLSFCEKHLISSAAHHHACISRHVIAPHGSCWNGS